MDMKTTYAELVKRFSTLSINSPALLDAFAAVQNLLDTPEKAEQFLCLNTPKSDLNKTLSYQQTLLGYMLSVSSLPRPNSSLETLQIEFFNDNARMSNSELNFLENMIAERSKIVGYEVYKIFIRLLKTPQTKEKFLIWLGRCIYSFHERKKMWSNQLLISRGTLSVNDGFLMNLTHALLQLSEPFVGPYDIDANSLFSRPFKANTKMLKIDPMYCKCSKEKFETDSAHILGLSLETYLCDKAEETEEGANKNFISECFFATHQVFAYGFRQIYERVYKLAQDVTEIQNVLSSDINHPARSVLEPRLDNAMCQFLNLKAVLNVPCNISMLMSFMVSTAAYLNHLAACYDIDCNSCDTFKEVTTQILKEKKTTNKWLSHIPEMLVENLVDFMSFMKHFNTHMILRYEHMLEPIMSTIITFMGNSKLIKNPHLRARFAEILESWMPHDYQGNYRPSGKIFEIHPLIDHLIPSLMNVFVSIEMTGEGVQFEQKFSYRRPMYVVLEYLWNAPKHRSIMKGLAQEAEENIESARQPLFLRFINLLINDGIFLLDEALSYMNKIHEFENLKRSQDWQTMDPQSRQRAEASQQHIGRLARFHNVLSVWSIGTLSLITNDIKSILCHPILADRIASMLNYFLDNLVGPKRAKFNVHDKNDYEFKPRVLVTKICQIYVNIGLETGNEKFKKFCLAVCSDDRSYSATLLPQAIEVLIKIQEIGLSIELEQVSNTIRDISKRKEIEDSSVDDIPEEFLDPLMFSIMQDPVLLPSSQKIVDRTTIARHLLSDQTDPFNRLPLLMENIVPVSDLKKRIQQFLDEKRNPSANLKHAN